MAKSTLLSVATLAAAVVAQGPQAPTPTPAGKSLIAPADGPSGPGPWGPGPGPWGPPDDDCKPDICIIIIDGTVPPPCGDKGHCLPACPSKCHKKKWPEPPCHDGKCKPEHPCHDGKCKPEHHCKDDKCEPKHHCKDGKCEPEHHCKDDKCEPKHHCKDGKCEPEHHCKDGKCEPKHHCKDGKCEPEHHCKDDKCKPEPPCHDGKCPKPEPPCHDGKCPKPEPPCKDGKCPKPEPWCKGPECDEKCHPEKCKWVPEGHPHPPCGSFEKCLPPCHSSCPPPKNEKHKEIHPPAHVTPSAPKTTPTGGAKTENKVPIISGASKATQTGVYVSMVAAFAAMLFL